MGCLCLSHSVNATEALFEPGWIPGQFEADDPASARLEVQTLSGDVRGKKRGRGAGQVSAELGSLRAVVLAAMHHGHCAAPPQPAVDGVERIPELAEDHDGFGGTLDERLQPRDLALHSSGVVCELAQTPKPCSFVTAIEAYRYGQ